MPIRSYAGRALAALTIGAAMVGIVGVSSASAAGCTVCLSPSGESYYGSTASSFNPPYSSQYDTYPNYSSSCSGYSCYGQPSEVTGQPRTNYVSGYTRSDGTYVDPYFRS
jgi:hypothetical protein